MRVLTLLPISAPPLARAPAPAPDAAAASAAQHGGRRVGRGAQVSWAMSPRMAERRSRMREVGARMFARLGVSGAALLDVAREAHVPVSAAAHGYRRRQDLVFDILYAYVDAMHEYVGAADEAHDGAAPADRLVAVIAALLEGIHDHQDAHQLMRIAFPSLAAEQREALRYVLRTLAYRLVAPLEGMLPELTARRDLQAPLIQSLLAMANHTPFWLRESGPMTRQAYARLMARAVVAAGAMPASG